MSEVNAAGERPTLRLVRGDAAPEEIAALLAVLSARAATAGETPRPVPRAGRWGDPAHAVRPAQRHGPGAWRASGRPR